jgi:hypothetical protein
MSLKARSLEKEVDVKMPVFACLLLMLTGIAGFAAEQAPAVGEEPLGDPDSPRYSELEKQKGAFRETWVLPGADFSRYDSLLVWDAQFEYRDVGPAESTRSTFLRTHKREFGISEKDRAEFEGIVTEAFEKEIRKGKRFEVVDDADADTLILRGALLDVVSFVPPPTVGRSDVYLATIGEATVTMELIDAGTGTVLALVSERIKVEPPGGRIDRFSMPANRVTVTADIRRAATSVAARLRKALDDAMKT